MMRKKKLEPKGQVIHAMSEELHRNALKWRKKWNKKEGKWINRYYNPDQDTFNNKPLDEYDSWMHAMDYLKLINFDAHNLIAPDGEILPMTPENETASHAGVSKWNELNGLNDYFLGDELLVAGRNSYYDLLSKMELQGTYSMHQFESLLSLTLQRLNRYEYPIENIVRHSDVSTDDIRGTNKGKKDPGSAFDYITFIKVIRGY